jgi:excisionase family DNA binding protein
MKEETFMTTKEVAKLISLSRGTVQKMVDSGEFKCWTTTGGHRRILASSVEKYLIKRMKGTL